MLRGLSAEEEWQSTLSRIEAGLVAQDSVDEFVLGMGLKRGVTGYSLHVVPVAIYAWLRHPNDFREALSAALNCGGDTDTVGAILGAMAGATVGEGGIPVEWREGVWEWPRSVAFMRKVAERLAEQMDSSSVVGAVSLFWPGIIPRNLLFLAVVLVHGFRRLVGI